MKISKLCKYAVIPAAILILSQTVIGKAIADTLTPAAVSSTASFGQTAQEGTTASTAKMATKAQGDSVSGDGWTIIPGIPGDGTRAATAAQPLPLLRQPPLRLPQRLLPQLHQPC